MGKKERNNEIVKTLLRKNFSDEDIIEITNITLEELKGIKNTMDEKEY